ncbi:hypothetical protein [Leisingera sp. NJS204]|uniref:hypothetical protein n=1 Tax=Leisingera sp. NJS204 TaxID=2508307 RepID=UPI0010119628|nr:hypothetical protein [Leisingera sp. NJS204]QAX31324.1 hypothetical protein ETW24_19150 [Leisingera sp. NJS204]
MAVKEQVSDDEVNNRLADWQQGDFTLSCQETLFLDAFEDSVEPHEAAFDEDVEGCVVISQTCDVVRGIGVIPYVTVCALVKIDEQRRSGIEKGQAPRLGLVDNLPEDTVVDFTRTMSVSKRLLVTWKRQRGCDGEARSVEFGRSLERYFGRFAFPEEFNKSVEPLRKAVYAKHEKASDLGKSLRAIREIRVFPYAGWNDAISVPITFLVILEEEDKREIKELHKVKEAVKDKFLGLPWVAPFSLHADQGLLVTTLADLTAVEYLNSYPLDLNSLSFARKFQRD